MVWKLRKKKQLSVYSNWPILCQDWHRWCGQRRKISINQDTSDYHVSLSASALSFCLFVRAVRFGHILGINLTSLLSMVGWVVDEVMNIDMMAHAVA